MDCVATSQTRLIRVQSQHVDDFVQELSLGKYLSKVADCDLRTLMVNTTTRTSDPSKPGFRVRQCSVLHRKIVSQIRPVAGCKRTDAYLSGPLLMLWLRGTGSISQALVSCQSPRQSVEVYGEETGGSWCRDGSLVACLLALLRSRTDSSSVLSMSNLAKSSRKGMLRLPLRSGTWCLYTTEHRIQFWVVVDQCLITQLPCRIKTHRVPSTKHELEREQSGQECRDPLARSELASMNISSRPRLPRSDEHQHQVQTMIETSQRADFDPEPSRTRRHVVAAEHASEHEQSGQVSRGVDQRIASTKLPLRYHNHIHNRSHQDQPAPTQPSFRSRAQLPQIHFPILTP